MPNTHIRLNIKPNAGKTSCAVIYAWSDKNPHVVYKYWHNNFCESLTRYKNDTLTNYENDYYISYTSVVSLDEWYRKVEESEFNDPKRHHLLHHNCAHAATFALEAAGIKLFHGKSYFFLNNAYDSPFRIPLCTLTPYDLFYFTKKHKLKQIKESKAELSYHAINHKLKSWCASTEKKAEKQHVTTILCEIERTHLNHPEHTEAHIDVMLKTLLLVTRLCPETRDYMQSANQFKLRMIDSQIKMRNRLIILRDILLFIYCCSLVFVLFDKKKLTLNQGSILLTSSMFSVIKMECKAASLKASKTEIEPTALSNSMEKLASLCKQI